MSNWKTYRIGNGLRGHHIFKARSVKEAWKVGCRLFNEAFPTPNGRIIYLDEKRVETQPLLTTKWVQDQLALPKQDRYFSNFEPETAEYWLTLAYGKSTEPLLT